MPTDGDDDDDDDFIPSWTEKNRVTTSAIWPEFGLQSGNQNEVVGRMDLDPSMAKHGNCGAVELTSGASDAKVIEDDDGNSLQTDSKSLIKTRSFVRLMNDDESTTGNDDVLAVAEEQPEPCYAIADSNCGKLRRKDSLA